MTNQKTFKENLTITFKINDIVKIKNKDILYRIRNINYDQVILNGYSIRIIEHALITDLVKATSEQIQNEDNKNKYYINRIINDKKTRNNKVLFGRILHIDGDENYLNSCLSLYKELSLPAIGLHIKEKDLSLYIEKVIDIVTPDIIVITGHDTYNGSGLKDINNYENSGEFVKAIRLIRKHFNANELVVIAGACGSHFEALIGSGANFASSPKRVNTHTYDPAIIAIKVSSTSFARTIDFNSALKYIENGKDAIGGIETNGKMKLLL